MIPFDTINPDTAHRYFKHWIAVQQKRHARYKRTHDRYGHKLPEILVTPPSKKVLKAGHKLVTKNIITEQAELSPKVKKLIKSQYEFKITELQKKHEDRIVALKEKIAQLEDELRQVTAELISYKKGTHIHSMTEDDVKQHIKVLEQKLERLNKKSEEYHTLAQRLADVKEKLMA